MKLVRVTGRSVTVICICCFKAFDATRGFADLHGHAYIDYYCGSCTEASQFSLQLSRGNVNATCR